MVRKYASRYGHDFLSCSRFPTCRGARSLPRHTGQVRGTGAPARSTARARTYADGGRTGSHQQSANTAVTERLQRLIHFFDGCLERESLRELRFRPSSDGKVFVALAAAPAPFLAGEAFDLAPGGQGEDLAEFVRERKVGSGARRLYLGYPVAWLPSDEEGGRELVPLMYGGLDVTARGETYRLSLEEPLQVNYLLLERAGLSLEEAVAVGAEIEELANEASEGSWEAVVGEQVARVAAEARLNVTEQVAPQELSQISLENWAVGNLADAAILFQADRVGYTVSVRTELERLAANPALASGTPVEQLLVGDPPASAPLLATDIVAVTPLSEAQREAVASSFVRRFTVVTGPPGTGKSQLVLNVIANALVRGETLLFASRNNKAVDVVCDRFAGLTDEAALLRTGRSSYRDTAIALIRRVVAGVRGPSPAELDRSQAELNTVRSRRKELERLAGARLQAEAQLEATAASYEAAVEAAGPVGGDLAAAVWDKGTTDLPDSWMGQLDERLQQLVGHQDGHLPLRERLISIVRRGYPLANQREHLLRVAEQFRDLFPTGIGSAASWAELIGPTIEARHASVAIQARARLRASQAALANIPCGHELASQLAEVEIEEAHAGSRYVRLARQAALSNMPDADRQKLEQYLRVVEQLAGPELIGAQMFARLKDLEQSLFGNIQAAFPVWAITSLTARRNLPLSPGLFDLVVIDEASQCDLPSALALLVRGKRALIIGDDKQLVHITPLDKETEHALANEAELSAEELVDFSYKKVSLFIRARQVAMGASGLLLLDEHYRSDPDIITFSNDRFYGGRLRIYTEPERLLPKAQGEKAIQWIDARGETVRPVTGSAKNEAEAQEVVRQVKELVANADRKVTIGVVTPFRLQKELIVSLLSQSLTADQIEAHSLVVDTAHGFQGDERDVMFFSPVISHGASHHSVDFVNSNENLFNVAITRARSRLVVCGDRATCEALGGLLADLAEYVARLAGQEAVDRLEAGGAFDTDEERRLFEVLVDSGLGVFPHRWVRGCEIDLAVEQDGARLAIEVDGSSHEARDGRRYLRDLRRDLKLGAAGWNVIRIPAWRVRLDPAWCREEVLKALGASRNGQSAPVTSLRSPA